jgi:RNA polymerase sigma-70 factor (ECF subfamily)
MLRSRLDRAFARFAATGDPLALTRVFDGCATELYRLGFHLLGDRHAAEDLVQHTFVVAIEQAKTFDRARRVLPWLCGILTHRALHLRRQARQRAAANEDVAAAERAVDPVELAGGREAEGVVVAAVHSLPEPYRQVLLLHLVHELTPKDIAEALARPDATVRTQLARGRELLRKALPAGIAGLAGGQVPPPARLGTVRAAVVAHAGRVVPIASGSAAGVGTIVFTGVLAMKKLLLAGVVLVAIVSSWLWLGGDPSLPPPTELPARVVADAAVQAAPLPSAIPPTANEVRRAAAPAVGDASTSALEVLVTWADGSPAADMPVRVRPIPLASQAWLCVERTGADGVARFAQLPPGAANALSGRGASTDVELVAGARQRATIALDRGIDVRGRVVDLDGRPVAGATLWMSIVRGSDDSEPVATSGADGSFAIRGAGSALVVTATASGLATAKGVLVADRDLVLTMRPSPGTLVGTVVDASGRPVADARVLVGLVCTTWQGNGVDGSIGGMISGQDLWPARFLRTDREGRFRSEGLPPWKWPLFVAAPGHAPHRSEVQVLDVGETEVVVQVTPGATVRGRLVDAAGGAIAGARITVFPQLESGDARVTLGLGAGGPFNPPTWCQARTTTDASGTFALRHVMVGKHQLGAAIGNRYVSGECELRDGETFVWEAVAEEVEAKGQPLHGRLVDEEGQPLVNWTVCVDRPEREHRRNRIPVREDGSFRTNRVPAGSHRLLAKPRAPWIGDEVDVGTFDVANCPLRVVVPRRHVPTGRLRGRVLVPAAQDPTRCNVLVGDEHVGKLDVDGRYEVGPLQRGSYHLRVEGAKFGIAAMGPFAVADGAVTEAGAFQVPTPGELVVVVLDAQGARVPEVWVELRPLDDGPQRGDLTQKDGVARGPVPAGRWRVQTSSPAPLAALELEVRAGETTDVRLVIPECVAFVLRAPAGSADVRSCRVRWRDAHGVLLRDAPMYFADGATDHALQAPPGRYTLDVTGAGGAVATATFDLRASEPRMVVELPLPTKPAK